MDTGHYISGAGHLALIGWLLFGGIFKPDHLPVEMTEVSVISSEQYAALVAAQQPPASTSEVAQPTPPEATPDVPEVTPEPDAVIEQPEPVQTETPPEDTPPEVTEQTLPPQTEVEDTPPELNEPVGDTAVLVPEVAPRPIPRPVPRVAPEPVVQPEPEVKPDTEEQPAVAPDAEGETVVEEPQEAQTPEDSTTEIVTEADKAPKASPRPPGKRPAAPKPAVVAEKPAAKPTETPAAKPTEKPAEAPAETPTPKPAEPATADSGAINDALSEALAGAVNEAPVPSGPPLSSGEREALRVAVSACWNIGALSTDASRTTIIVGVNMNSDGTPVAGSIKLLSATGGSDAAAKQAFEAAKRAIIRCGGKGYSLPQEKYSQWQDIEMTFDPTRSR